MKCASSSSLLSALFREQGQDDVIIVSFTSLRLNSLWFHPMINDANDANDASAAVVEANPRRPWTPIFPSFFGGFDAASLWRGA